MMPSDIEEENEGKERNCPVHQGRFINKSPLRKNIEELSNLIPFLYTTKND